MRGSCWCSSSPAGEAARSPAAFFFQAEDGIRDADVTGVQTCALPILGELDDDEDLIASYRRKLDEASLPDQARKAVEREIDRLERTPEQNPEHGWIRTWLDTVTELPFGKRSEDRL